MLIDANKYLDFYKSERIATLIIPLMNLRSHILVTRQIVDEVERNKLSSFTDALREAKKRGYGLQNVQAPLGLLSDTEQNIELKSAVTSYNDRSRALSIEIDETFKQLFVAISDSADIISTQLKAFFGTPLSPDESVVGHARHRKDVGNPPGKSDDPLGDQITWEQFLIEIRGEGRIWIVTADRDYYQEFGNERRLNPFLVNEIKAATRPDVEIRVFDSIARAIPDFIQTNGLKDDGLPAIETLDEIAAVEESLDNPVSCLPFPPASQYMPPSACPKCGKKGLFYGPQSLPSPVGYTWQFVCSKCGCRIDTGDFVCD